MSLASNQASMTNHKLDVARSIDGFENVLIKSLQPSAAQEALFPNGGMYAGRCVGRAADGTAELGVSGRRVPYFLFRTSNLPSTGSFSDTTPIEDAPDITFQDGVDKAVLCYCGIEGIELVTTEFDTTLTYALNDHLKAPDATAIGGDDAAKLAGAGVLTNDTVVYGKDAVVGVVSEVALKTPHKIGMLQFYGLYRPPIEGLADGFTEPTWLP